MSLFIKTILFKKIIYAFFISVFILQSCNTKQISSSEFPNLGEQYYKQGKRVFERYRLRNFLFGDWDFQHIKSKKDNKPITKKEAYKCVFRLFEKPVYTINWEQIKKDSIKQFKHSGELIKYLELRKIYYCYVYYQDSCQLTIIMDKTEGEKKFKIGLGCTINYQQKLYNHATQNNKNWFLINLVFDHVCYMDGNEINCYTTENDTAIISKSYVSIINAYLRNTP